MSLIKWSPSNSLFPSMSSLVDNFFKDDDFFNGLRTGSSLPAVNVVDTKEAYTLEVAAPGLKKEDFKVTVDKGVLTIKAERSTEEKEEKDNYTRREFSYSSFNRSFWLPEHVNAEGVNAKYDEGILKITLPKVVEEVEGPAKAIEIA